MRSPAHRIVAMHRDRRLMLDEATRYGRRSPRRSYPLPRRGALPSRVGSSHCWSRRRRIAATALRPSESESRKRRSRRQRKRKRRRRRHRAIPLVEAMAPPAVIPRPGAPSRNTSRTRAAPSSPTTAASSSSMTMSAPPTIAGSSGTSFRSAAVRATLYRVAFGKPGTPAHNTTVSEGQGYGMVIVPLMAGHDPEAQTIFDGLWSYALTHRSCGDERLMLWRIPNRREWLRQRHRRRPRYRLRSPPGRCPMG